MSCFVVCMVRGRGWLEELRDDDLKHKSRLAPDEIGALVDMYWHDVWQYALFLTRRESVAEDIAQDTFLRALRGIDSYRGEGPVKHWLFRIARNTALNYRKSSFWRKVVLVGLLPTGSSVSAEREYWRGELVNEVWAAVWNLPVKYREPLVLYAHYEWSYSELAELLDVSQGTVKSRLYRGRELLRKRLKEGERDG